MVHHPARGDRLAPRASVMRPLLLALVLSFAFGAFVKVAFADHYHVVNNVPHGFVHGDSLTDGSFFTRSDGRPANAPNTACYFDSIQNPFPGEPRRGHSYEYVTICNYWSRDAFQSNPTECHWRAYVAADGARLPGHHHRPDNYCG